LVSSRSPIPLYHQVFGVLRQRVADGTYAVGEKISPEDELAAEFDVSRATIRLAVDELVRLGIVSRQQGRGTFVERAGGEAFGQAFSGTLADLIDETRRSRIRSVDITHKVPIPGRIAEALQLAPPKGTVVRRVRTMDGRPFAYTVNFLSPAHGKLLTKRELSSQSLMDLLERKGVRLGSARQTIRAQLADVAVAESLEVGPGAAVLFVERLLLDEAGAPVEFVQSWYRGDLYEYTVTFDERGEPPRLRSNLA
jgi:GntR family transcriptional regulator